MPICGKHRGVVLGNVDPTGIGRLQVNVPDVPGVSGFAMPSVPFAGPQVGFLAIPPIGANVWVEFEGGDPNLPIWSGCFWNAGDAPNSDPNVKLFKTAGVTLTFDDGGGGFILEVGPPASNVTMKLSMKNGDITIDNGQGAVINITGPTVDVNLGGLTVT